MFKAGDLVRPRYDVENLHEYSRQCIKYNIYINLAKVFRVKEIHFSNNWMMIDGYDLWVEIEDWELAKPLTPEEKYKEFSENL